MVTASEKRKLSVLLQVDIWKRLKIEAIERNMLESAIVEEAMTFFWQSTAAPVVTPEEKDQVVSTVTDVVESVPMDATPEPVSEPVAADPVVEPVIIPPAPVEPVAAPPVVTKKIKRARPGDAALLLRVEAAIRAGKMTGKSLMRELDMNVDGFRTNWQRNKVIPFAHVQRVEAILVRLGY